MPQFKQDDMVAELIESKENGKKKVEETWRCTDSRDVRSKEERIQRIEERENGERMERGWREERKKRK